MLISLSRYSMLAHLLAGIWYAHNIGSVPSDLPVRAGFVVQRDLRATSNNVTGVALGSLHSSAWGGKVSWGSRLSTRRRATGGRPPWGITAVCRPSRVRSRGCAPRPRTVRGRVPWWWDRPDAGWA